jgi:S-DNA-T family DNA segregation ATPase FtsK/SpoIIIE
MRAADRSLDIITFVSEHFRDIIRRRLSELAGLALISLSVLGAIALATWSSPGPVPQPCDAEAHPQSAWLPRRDLRRSSDAAARSRLHPALVPEILLGWRLISHKPVGEKWRGMLWIVATFLAAAFASTLPHIGSWPLRPDSAALPAMRYCARPHGFSAHLSAPSRVSSCASSLVWQRQRHWCWRRVPLTTMKNLPRARADDEEDSETDEGDHASAWLGMIVHALLSWKARIGRMIRGETRARTPMPVVQGPRHEPRFDGEDDSDYEDEAEEDDDEDAPAPRRRAAQKAAPVAAATVTRCLH